MASDLIGDNSQSENDKEASGEDSPKVRKSNGRQILFCLNEVLYLTCALQKSVDSSLLSLFIYWIIQKKAHCSQ